MSRRFISVPKPPSNEVVVKYVGLPRASPEESATPSPQKQCALLQCQSSTGQNRNFLYQVLRTDERINNLSEVVESIAYDLEGKTPSDELIMQICIKSTIVSNSFLKAESPEQVARLAEIIGRFLLSKHRGLQSNQHLNIRMQERIKLFPSLPMIVNIVAEELRPQQTPSSVPRLTRTASVSVTKKAGGGPPPASSFPIPTGFSLPPPPLSISVPPPSSGTSPQTPARAPVPRTPGPAECASTPSTPAVLQEGVYQFIV